MPIATNDKTKDSEQMFKALKVHILRERQRKKQEHEAEIEEERLRKEREAREQQDVMSLGETREQIAQLENKLKQLREEKHQLFLQLKKVLNEDDKRRQQVKENNEMLTMQNKPMLNNLEIVLGHPQLFIPQNVPRGALLTTQPSFKPVQTGKRTRSPSPPPPVSVYHTGYATAYKQPTQAYAPTVQKDDNRRGHELVRAVLWNKTPQYSNQPGAFYGVPPQELLYYPPMPRDPPSSSVPPRSVYEGSGRAPAGYHLAPAPPPPASSKPGGITSGYPVRGGPPSGQYASTQPPPGSLYQGSQRGHYQQPPPGSQSSLGYPPRD